MTDEKGSTAETQSMTLYIIKNVVTDRVYVGITTRPLQVRWSEHKRDAKAGVDRALYRAMRKHGAESFSIESVDVGASWDDLCAKESALLKSLPKRRRYNMTTGGEGAPGHQVSEQTRSKIRAGHVGKRLSPEHRAKLAAAKLGKKLPPRTKEHSARISAGLIAAHARRKSA